MKRPPWIARLAAPLAAALLATGGMAAGTAEAAPPASSPSNITLLYGVQSQDNWWFPDWTAQYCGGEGQIFNMAYLPLIIIGNNGLPDWSQSIASGITVSHDDTVFTVHMGSRYKWSNGQPVTAYDALYMAQIMLAATKPNMPWTNCGDGIGGLPTLWKSVSAPNPSTFVITTTKPVNPLWFEENAIGQIVPIPKSVWDHSSNWKTELSWILKVGQNSYSPEFKIIDGPYGYGVFKNEDYETIVANPKYTGPNPPHIKTITFLYETSESSLWAAALRGTFAEFPVPSQYDSETATLERAAGYRIMPAFLGVGFDYVALNFNPQDPVAPLLKQLYIRQALQMAINQPAMLRLANNVGYTDYGPIPPEPRTVFYTPQEQRDGYPYNPAAGKRLLEAHGWHLKNGVMTNAKGQTLTFTLTLQTGNQWVADAAQLWQSALKQEGIVLKIQPNAEAGTIAFTTHKWQLVWWSGGGFTWGYVPDYYPTGYGLFVPGSTANPGDFSDRHLTALILATHAATASNQQAIARMWAYEEYAAKILPVLYMPTPTGLQAVQPWLHIPKNGFLTIQGLDFYNTWYTTPTR